MKLIQTFMLFFFHHFYHGLAWSYDLIAAIVSFGRWREWGQTVLPHLQTGRVLELGFGPGHLQSALPQARFQAIGLDESRQMCRQAAHNLRKNKQTLRLIRGYAQNLPFATETFENVVATFPSEYIVAPETLTEAERVLKVGGRLVVALSVHFEGTNLANRAASWLFHVTGQSEDLTEMLEEKIKAHFTASRLRVNLVQARVGKNMVLLIVAEKVTGRETLKSSSESAQTL